MAKPKLKKKVYIIEDHPVTRDGFAELINYQSDLVACGHAGTAEKALAAIEASEPALVITDISLPDAHGLELIKQILGRRPGLRILVLSLHDEEVYAQRALRAGAKGYVMKAEPTDVVLMAVRKVLQGDIYLSPRMQQRHDAGDMNHSEFAKLSDRELEVFEFIGRGLSTREIGSRLGLSVTTIETYRSRLKERLNLATGIELTHRAVEWFNRQRGLT